MRENISMRSVLYVLVRVLMSRSAACGWNSVYCLAGVLVLAPLKLSPTRTEPKPGVEDRHRRCLVGGDEPGPGLA